MDPKTWESANERSSMNAEIYKELPRSPQDRLLNEQVGVHTMYSPSPHDTGVGRGRGEGKALQILVKNRVVSARVPLSLTLSPLRREREKVGL